MEQFENLVDNQVLADADDSNNVASTSWKANSIARLIQVSRCQ